MGLQGFDLERATLVFSPLGSGWSRLTEHAVPFLLSVAKRQPVVLAEAKAKDTGHLRGDIFGMSLVSEAALASSQNFALVVLGGLPLTAESAGSLISQNRHRTCSYFARRKSSGLDLLYLTIPSPFRTVSSCRSLVPCFGIDISSIILLTVNHDKIRRQAHHHLPPVAHALRTSDSGNATQYQLGPHRDFTRRKITG